MADRGGIQLLSETRKRIEIRTPGENRLRTWGILLLVLVLCVFFVCKWYSRSLNTQIATLDGQLTDLEQKRDKEAEKTLLTFNKQADLMAELLKNHIFWSRAFSKLERMLQNSIRLKTFSGSAAKQSFQFTAQAPLYSAIARQIASFMADGGVQDVIIGGIKSSNLGVLDFMAEIQFKKEDFLKK